MLKTLSSLKSWGVVCMAIASFVVASNAFAQIGHISQQKQITCASNQYRRSMCDAGGRVLQGQMIQQYSRSACVEGVSYGFTDSAIWVAQGCRATFVVDVARMPGQDRTVACASIGNRLRSCPVVGAFITEVELLRQDSRAACIEGQTYGYTENSIWVNHGCRGLFRVYGMSHHPLDLMDESLDQEDSAE